MRLEIHGPNNKWVFENLEDDFIRQVFKDYENDLHFAIQSTFNSGFGMIKKTIVFNPSLIVAIELHEKE
jgi:hypothetical protein